MTMTVPILIAFLIGFLPGSYGNLPPVFIQNIDLAVIQENTPVGTSVFQLIGADPENSTVTYGLEGTDRLAVDKKTGIVTVAAPIDRERNDTLQFTITLEDVVGGGHENNVVRYPVNVIILDENDNVPRFKNVPYETEVKEDVLPGTTVFKGIQVTDADIVGSGLQIRCAFHPQFPDACEKFAVVSEEPSPNFVEASLVLRKPLDYSERQIYQVKLIADDGVHNVTTAVVVRVGDVQNRPPVFIGSMTGIVNEDDPVGTLVLTVKAEDGDKGNPRQIVYELVSNPEEFFAIDRNTGELRTAKKLDKEVLSSTSGVITVRVKASELVDGKPEYSKDTISMAALTVTIRDVNDEAPTFNRISYTVNIEENAPDGTPLPNLDMFVQDTDVGTNSVFNIGLIDSSGFFTVEPPLATGSTSVSIRVVNGPLDYENPNQRKFILLVVAEEAFTNPKLSSSASVTVNIVDANDNIPVFEHKSYKATIAEDAAPGTVVATISATDRDTGSYGEAGIKYSLFGNGADRFFVNPTSGVITVAPCETPGTGNCLDFETRPSYFLSFQATDDNGKGQTSVVPLTITLVDANDNPPHFYHESYTAIIDEGSVKFEPPLRVQAHDPDVTSVLTYSIIGGDSHNLFAIDNRTGDVSVRDPAGLDVSALRTDLIVLTVQANDGGKGIATTTVKITVRDSNNNSPVFQKSSYFAAVPESSLPGTIVEQVSASDADTGPNAQITYRIQKGGYDNFVINASTGIVTVAPVTKLDYDVRDKYFLEVIAVDGGIPVHTGTTTLTIQVLNNNDKEPYFTPTTQRTQVSEGAEIDHVFYKLKAKDPDVDSPDSLKFSVQEPITAIDKDGRPVHPSIKVYKSFFSVDANTGEVRVARKLNRDVAAILTLTVVVTDVSAIPQQTGTGTLVVTIIDLNDYPPSFARPWTPEKPEISINIMEEQPIGSVVASFVATDPDSNIAGYEITPENEYFAIDKTSGVLTIKNRVDYEQMRELKFSIIARDTGIPQMSAVAAVTAHIININDNDPVFSEPIYHAKIMENSPKGTVVTTVLATDADYGNYGKVKYSLLGERSADFTINQQGTIKVAAAALLDREETPTITLQVVATDQGVDVNTRRSITVPVYISLLDENDNPPRFTQREYEASIVANIHVNPPTPIIQINAIDLDEGIHAEVSYSILSGNDNGTFAINSTSGVIYPARSLDEHLKQYRLKVQARDLAGQGPNFDEAQVNIRILEINQDKPRFLVPALPNMTVVIPENQSIPNYLVMTVEARDNDRGENGRVLYYLKVGNMNMEETDEFQINPVTGELRTRVILDREKQPQYELVLAARDNGSPIPFETLQLLTISLKDVDDNIPEFPRTQSTSPYVFTIEENQPPNTLVGYVSATDQDIGENAMIYYYIIDGNWEGFFKIDKLKGGIYSNTTFDREERDEYELVIKATSNPDYMVYVRPERDGQRARERSYNDYDPTLALVRIHITDVNDNAPVFVENLYLTGVKYTTDVGELVTVVSAVDKDGGANGTLTYRLDNIQLYRRAVPGGGVRPIPSPFNITDDGRITTTQLMAQYSYAHFQISVAAREIAYPHRSAKAVVKVWVYEPNQLVRITVGNPPEEINRKKRMIASLLTNATGNSVVIDDIRYHVNEDNRIIRDWTDMYIHVVDEEDKMIPVPKVLEAMDSSIKFLKLYEESVYIDRVVPAYAGTLAEEFDLAFAVLITLLIVLFIGIITVAVCCFCLKSWYTAKIQEALVKNEEMDSTPINTTENPLWTEQKLKLYEEQELSMSVAPDQDHMVCTEADINPANYQDDSASALYATLRKSTVGSINSTNASQFRSALGNIRNEYATLNGRSSLAAAVAGQQSVHSTLKRQREPDIEGHEYHELPMRTASESKLDRPPSSQAGPSNTNAIESQSANPFNTYDDRRSTLIINEDGEPELVAELL